MGHKKEHLFEEMDENNDKMISPNEFDKDLKWEFHIISLHCMIMNIKKFLILLTVYLDRDCLDSISNYVGT